MGVLRNTFSSLHALFLSEKKKKKGEDVILYIAIVSFLLHLLMILVNKFQLFGFHSDSDLLNSPIAAVYTPFSFILIYEVYLLVYYLPHSMSTYIGKQYEIITLIIIRRIFKDLANLELSSDWFSISGDLQFTYDIVASLLLFLLILFFNRLRSISAAITGSGKITSSLQRFIDIKKGIASVLVPVLLLLAVYRVGAWALDTAYGLGISQGSLKDINNIFFDEFFTILILVDVVLLLFSFIHTDKFHKVIRNSGFIISTILIRLSFGVEGLINTLLIVTAVLFGVLLLLIHNYFEKSAKLEA